MILPDIIDWIKQIKVANQVFNDIEEASAFFAQRDHLGIKPGLERMQKLLDYVKNPEKNMKIIHIAGTNGKGSTLNFLKEALIANGYTVGSFVSPSLGKITEHIFTNNVPISNTAFLRILNQLSPIITILDQTGDYPTEYEILVAIALLFIAESADVALIETGMGGKEDATNCIFPSLSIITNIGKDHMRFLGETYAEIAEQKAGIIKEQIPVVTGVIDSESIDVIREIATEKNAPVYQFITDFTAANQVLTINKQESFTFISNKIRISNVLINMKGKHQVTNASIALEALLILKETGWSLKINSIIKGFLSASFPGRFEQIYDSPVVIIDGAHNEEGINSFLQTVARYYPHADKHLIFGAFRDKPLKNMVHAMESCFASVTYTSFSHKRAAEAKDFYDFSDSESYDPDWQQVIDEKLKNVMTENVIFITGSLNFISLVRKYFVNLKDL